MGLSRVGVRLSDWFERWFPDAFVLALTAVLIVYAACLGNGASPLQAAQWFGQGFWDLTKFTLQMAMVLVSGYAVATSPAVYRGIQRLAAIPKDGRSAVAFVALFSMLSSLASWSFSLIFSGFLAREVAHRVKDADYRALGAAAYMGLGSVWALGLSSSAALIMAASGSLPPALLKISGVIPLGQTLGLWQSAVVTVCLLLVTLAVAYASAPPPELAFTMESMGVPYEPVSFKSERPRKPGEWLEHSPALTVAVAACGLGYLWRTVASRGPGELLELNNYIFAFLVLGLLLHWRPRSFLKAVTASVPATAGILVQYPFYAAILKMLTESGLASQLAHFFISVSTQRTYPLLVGAYSAVLGLFVPSAGGKWLIEAPYLLEAAKTLQVHLGWVVQTYNAAEALPNLIHPFFMLPLLGILGIKARDVVGFTALQFAVHVPLVLLLVWILNGTLSYAAPVLP
ncbi:MAG: short-chain fatty acid transporter [Elusimicrobia bacterium]|nr:short-chain fatty acid transporter [Elusimicrobiota bacterium]